MSNTVLYGLGALIAAEATGVTDFSGSGGGGVNVEVPTKPAGASIPTTAGKNVPDPTVIMPQVPNGGGSTEALFAAMSMAQNDRLQQVKESVGKGQQALQQTQEKTQSGYEMWKQQAEKYTDSASSSSRSSEPDPRGPAHSTGEQAGRAVSDTIWGMAERPAIALDEGTWLDGDVSDNTADIVNGTAGRLDDGTWLDGDWRDNTKDVADAVNPFDGKNKSNEGPLTPDKSPQEVTNDVVEGAKDTYDKYKPW